jgi:hypothetical protein
MQLTKVSCGLLLPFVLKDEVKQVTPSVLGTLQAEGVSAAKQTGSEQPAGNEDGSSNQAAVSTLFFLRSDAAPPAVL